MPETPQRGYPSTHEQCLLAARTVIRSLALPDLHKSEIEYRDEWFNEDQPYRGITIHDAGEGYNDGVIGLEDVAYRCAVTMACLKDRSSQERHSPILAWRSTIRRRFNNQRIPVGDFDAGVLRHVCKVSKGRPSIPRGKKFQDFSVDQLIISFWVREFPDPGE